MTKKGNNMAGEKLLRWIYIVFTGILSVAAVNVNVNEEAILLCPPEVAIDYPTWYGPSNLASPLTNGSHINEPGFAWVNKTHLNISQAQTLHSGIYLCSNGTANSSVTLNVFDYEVTVEFLNASGNMLKGMVNKQMTVTCQVSGGNPKPNVTISLADKLQNPPDVTVSNDTYIITENKTYTVDVSATFNATNELHQTNITCSASFDGQNATTKFVDLYIVYPPTDYKDPPRIDSSENVSLGSDANVSCSTVSRPETEFAWLVNMVRYNTTNGEFTASDLNISVTTPSCEQNSTSGMYHCQSNMKINNVQKTDIGKNISCEYIFEGEVQQIQRHYRISIRYYATKVNLIGNTTAQVESTGNATIRLTCSSDESNPASTLFWYLGKSDNVSEASRITSMYSPVINYTMMYDGKIVTQDIDIVVNRTMHGEHVFCCVSISDTENTCDMASININYHATKANLTGNTTVEVDSTGHTTIRLSCSSDESNPASTLFWYLGKSDNVSEASKITSNYSTVTNDTMMYGGKTVTQDIDIVVNRTMHGEHVFCCVSISGTKKTCDMDLFNVFYPPQLSEPKFPEYRSYVGDNVSIPCIADSRPTSVIVWYQVSESTLAPLSNNTAEQRNVQYLKITNVKWEDAGNYMCRAWLETKGIDTAVNKSTSLKVMNRPPEPTLVIVMDEFSSYVSFSTTSEPQETARQFYLQYKKVSAVDWLEIQKGYQDTLPGQQARTYNYTFSRDDLEPSTEYQIRMKSIDEYGLVAYSTTNSFKTSAGQPSDEEEMVTYIKYRNAILISVLVTAGGFIIIIIGIVCLVKHGKCLSSSAKSYVM